MKKVGELVLLCFAGIGIIGLWDAGVAKEFGNPAIPLYILVVVCAIGFLTLADKK